MLKNKIDFATSIMNRWLFSHARLRELTRIGNKRATIHKPRQCSWSPPTWPAHITGTLENRTPSVTFDAQSRPLRYIWLHHALRLMQLTPMDNTEIALQLNYSEENNVARDFYKELGYKPNIARQKLVHHSPEELLHP